MLPDNPALNKIRETAGQTKDQVSITNQEVSDKTYGDWLNENPALETVERVASGGSISDGERNTSLDKVKESIQESTGNFRETVENAGVNPNDAFADQPSIDDQKIQDLINPVPSLQGQLDTPDFEVPNVEAPGFELPGMPEIPQPQVNLGLGEAAKYLSATVITYLIVREVA
jgi:hypothetical protein